MRILLSGASGLVGSNLAPFLVKRGHDVVRLTRGSSGKSDQTVLWDPAQRSLALTHDDHFDAVINLSGENLGAKRWNPERKKALLESRIVATTLFAETIAGLGNPPEVFINASAIGFYGDRGDTMLTEDNHAGTGFLADVCAQWERATAPAQRVGIRTVKARLGMVLARDGGALPRMARPFRFGLGGKLGSGQQYMSWIAMHDLLEAVLHSLYNAELSGPVNFVSPNPVTNAEFTRELARRLKRPALFSAPGWWLAALVGSEMAAELLLSSTRVEPAKLTASGFDFSCPTLNVALRAVL